jgi:hypothetical protein
MRLARVMSLVLAMALLSAAPAVAGKTKVYAPPGKAGSSQYSEVVPTGGGNVQTPAMGAANPTAKQISSLGAGGTGLRKLSKLGKQGAAAAQFAQQTAPAIVHSTHGLNGPSAPSGGKPAKAAPLSPTNGSAITGITSVLGGSDAGGIGVLLPLLLAFCLGAAVALSVARVRRERRPPA